MPPDPIKSIYRFGGWYKAPNGGGTKFDGSTTVTGHIMVYAKWEVLSFIDKLTWINTNAVEGGAYTITLTKDETIAPTTLSYGNKTVSVTIEGDTTERTIDLSSTGSLFTIGSRVTLSLDNNVTLQGRIDNTASLVRVNSGGTLVMKTGSKISGNTTSTYPGGGGVSVSSGTFTMNNGTISGNISSIGGGVSVSSSGTFTMNNGTISGNTASNNFGGGVYVYGGTFTMNNGTISDNTASSSGGGGVYVASGIFTMNNGTISDNTASSIGGGVSVSSSGTTFTMNDGIISDNSSNYGGGVHMSGGTFTMNNGIISGNTAPGSGGGVYVSSSGTFTMYDGIISGNTSDFGGGVYVSSSTFIKQQSGGIIYGSNENDSNLKNTATFSNNNGHAVYVSGSPGKKRNTTAGVGVALDSTKTISEGGGWE
jgi:hypothetical protein